MYVSVSQTEPVDATYTKDNGDETGLIYSDNERLPLKDFGCEVRPALDVALFIKDSVLLIDVEAPSSSAGLVDLLLPAMLHTPDLVQEAKMILFTNDTVPMLARTIQATGTNDNGTSNYDQSWICALGNLPSLERRHVGIVRLKQPTNMGSTCQDIRLFALILCPSKEKATKNALETGRTFATLLSDVDFRHRLMEAPNEDDFKSVLLKHTQQLTQAHSVSIHPSGSPNTNHQQNNQEKEKCWSFGQGIYDDLKRRLPHYVSDYTDGISGHKTPQKVLSTTFFLYFACILPAIAFGVLNDHNTHGRMNVKKVITGQTIGGLIYVIFGGQPLLIMLTTAPLALYIKVIYSICEDFELDFFAFYAAVGLWSAFFLILYSLFDVSRLMKWSTRSTEEIFALFISIAFCVDAGRDTLKNFRMNYHTCDELAALNATNITDDDDDGLLEPEIITCDRASSLLFLLLMFGTVWLGLSLFNFNKTPYLQAGKREALADYSLPIAVVLFTFVGSYIFQDIPAEVFNYDEEESAFTLPPMEKLSLMAVLGAMGLGFTLSLLFFMDQNISSAMVNNPCNKLKKGAAYHYDLFVVAIMTALLSVFGFPWIHACLPHSPLHVRSLADIEERVDQGHVHEIIVRVRETRLTGMFSHILIGLSLLLLPRPLAYIPTAVLNGLFLYMAITSLNGNQMFERFTLFFTEQAAYPPNHYIRRVPQRKVHQFTGCQLLQLGLMCLFGFAPYAYMKMVFPLIILLLLPLRHMVVPKLIEPKYLDALDGEN